MIVEEFRDYTKSKKGSKRLLLSCDECDKEFIRASTPVLCRKIKQFCSQSCAVSSSFVQEKMQKTMLVRYGARSPLQAKELKRKAIETCLKRFGLTNGAKAAQAKRKTKKTNLEKYGVEHPSMLDKNKNLRKKTNLEKYGVENVQQANCVKQKTRKTFLSRYGVGSGFETKNARKNRNTRSAKLKAHQTMKVNGTYGKSKSEDEFYEFLCYRFSPNNVKRQVRINDWNIDFKVNNFYVQFDGAYWHGLNRPLQEIKSSSNLRDEVILKTFYRDQEQNKWFLENNIKLIRVTDKEFVNDDHFYLFP